MAAQMDLSNMNAMNSRLLDFMRTKTSPPGEKLKLPCQAIIKSKYDRQAYMLNRVQQARYEKQIKHISIEKRVHTLSSALGVKAMSKRQEQIELFKEKAAQDKIQRENMEHIQKMAAAFFAEERRRNSLSLVNSDLDFIDTMTSSKLNQLLQTTLPEQFIDKMLGQERLRQQRRDLYLSQKKSKEKPERKPRTLFELIQMLKDQGKIKVRSLPTQMAKPVMVTEMNLKPTTLEKSNKNKMRWKRAFSAIVRQHRAEKETAAKLSSVDKPDEASAPVENANKTRPPVRRAVTCSHKPPTTHTYAHRSIACKTAAPRSQSENGKSSWGSVLTKMRTSKVLQEVSQVDPETRKRVMINHEKNIQLATRLKINKYILSLESAPKVDASYISITAF